jgi:head-tail adaptor
MDIGKSLRNSIPVSNLIYGTVWDSLIYSVNNPVYDSVWASVRDSVDRSVWASVRDSVNNSVRLWI